MPQSPGIPEIPASLFPTLVLKSGVLVILFPYTRRMEHDFEEPPTGDEDHGGNKAKYFIFTAWTRAGSTHDDYDFEVHRTFIQYLKFGCETCPRTGKPHYQGYCVSTKKMKYTTMRNVLKSFFHGSSVWIKGMRASLEKNDAYVEKEGCVHTFGERPQLDGDVQQRRAKGGSQRIEVFAKTIASGVPLHQAALADPYTFLQYSGGSAKLAAMVPRPFRRREPRVVELWVGPTRAGKSWDAIPDGATTHTCFRHGAGLGEFLDGYIGQPLAIFDEFRGAGSRVQLATALTWFDTGISSVGNVKGTTTFFDPDRIIVTSNEHPRGWYDWSTRMGSYYALMARFNVIRVYHDWEGRGVAERRTSVFVRGSPTHAAFAEWMPEARVEPLPTGVGVRVTGQQTECWDDF